MLQEGDLQLSVMILGRLQAEGISSSLELIQELVE
jgi:hypothetical protein